MSAARALSPDDVAGLRQELAAGGTPTVWFTPAAVGLPAGRSGKVVAVDEPAEGDFIQVRPAGSKDVLSFSAGEVTLVKPPRKRKAAGAATSSNASTSPEAKPSTPRRNNTAADAAGGASTGTSASTQKEAKAGASASTRQKPRKPPRGATLTLTADQEGHWSAEVVIGQKRVLRPTPVPASAVAQAAKELHSDVASAVEPLIEAAREQQRTRVEQLREELAHAERMLDELSS